MGRGSGMFAVWLADTALDLASDCVFVVHGTDSIPGRIMVEPAITNFGDEAEHRESPCTRAAGACRRQYDLGWRPSYSNRRGLLRIADLYGDLRAGVCFCPIFAMELVAEAIRFGCGIADCYFCQYGSNCYNGTTS